MISNLFFVVLGIASAYTFKSAKHAFVLLMMVGFAQDLVRKVTPGEPIIFIVTVGMLFGCILLGVWSRRGFAFSFEPFFRWSSDVQMPLIIFLLVLILQLFHSVLRYNNLVVGLIGLTTYVAPFLAVIVGYYLVNTIEDVRRFLRIYAWLGVLVAFSVLLSFIGYDWVILKEVGAGLKIYDQGTVLKSYSGMMRTGEIAAWHISTAACLILALTVSSEKSSNNVLVVVAIVLMLLAVVLTGRRKMLMLFSLFLTFYFLVYLYYRKTLDAKYFFSIFFVGIVVWFGYETVNLQSYSESLSNYINRSTSVFADASGRFLQLGVKPIHWAYERVGILGGGLGIASQGNYLFNISNVAGGSGEGGLGKIMVELGLPGLLCIIWLFWSISRYIDSGLKLSAQPFVRKQILPLMASLTVMLGVNAVTFSVATQVYGDIFVLLLLGLFGGFIFAFPKIIIHAAQQDQPLPTSMQSE